MKLIVELTYADLKEAIAAWLIAMNAGRVDHRNIHMPHILGEITVEVERMPDKSKWDWTRIEKGGEDG